MIEPIRCPRCGSSKVEYSETIILTSTWEQTPTGKVIAKRSQQNARREMRPTSRCADCQRALAPLALEVAHELGETLWVFAWEE